ncbi:MAG TPA: phage major capsid protein [Anaerolineae bacterium]|nr:phage major capsid protein [Anaerolineae bacterium]
MDIGALREEAVALSTQAGELFDKIQKGDEPFEKMQEAEKMVAEAGKKLDLATGGKAQAEQFAVLTEGMGSRTAGAAPEEVAETKARWDSALQWLMAVTASGVPKHTNALLKQGVIPPDFEEKLLQEAVGTSGGFLSPVAYRPELFAKPAEDAIVRPRAVVIPMSTTQLQMPSLDQTILPANAKSAYFAGILYEWIEETESKPELDIKFKMIDLILHELAGWIPVSNRLIAHSAISMDALLRRLFGQSMADAEDWWFLNGNGVGQPQGVIAAPCTIQPNRAGANAIVWADIMAMYHAFEQNPRGVWVAHVCTMEQIIGLKDGNNNYMWMANMRDGMPARLLGYPIIFTERVPNLGTKGDIGLYDFGYYLIGDGEGPVVESSIHERFRANQTTYRVSELVDGKPWLSAHVDLRPTGAVAISPFVSLDVPAS